MFGCWPAVRCQGHQDVIWTDLEVMVVDIAADGEERMNAQEVLEKARRGTWLSEEVVRSEQAPSPAPVPGPPAKPKKGKSFAVRLLGAVGAGAGAGGEVLFFQFWDTENKLTAFYIYFGGGIGVSAKVMPKGTGTGPGDWNPFETAEAVSVGSFGSFARFTTVGGGAWSANWLNVMAPGESGPLYLALNTGTTWGAGASTTVGRLVWYPKEIMLFSGD